MVKVFPNPTRGKVELEFDESVSLNIGVFAADGRLVKELEIDEKRSVTIDLSNEPQGMYFIETSTGEETNKYRVLKQ